MITNAQQEKHEAAHDRQALEQRRLDRGDCPKCGSENTILRMNRPVTVPICWRTECVNCGHGGEPS